MLIKLLKDNRSVHVAFEHGNDEFPITISPPSKILPEEAYSVRKAILYMSDLAKSAIPWVDLDELPKCQGASEEVDKKMEELVAFGEAVREVQGLFGRSYIVVRAVLLDPLRIRQRVDAHRQQGRRVDMERD